MYHRLRGNINIGLGCIFIFGIFCILYSLLCLTEILSTEKNSNNKKNVTSRDVIALFVLGIISILASIAGFYFDLNNLFPS